MVYISFSEITHVEQLTWYLIDSKAEQMLAIIFPGSSDDKQSVCNAGDLGSIPGLGRSPDWWLRPCAPNADGPDSISGQGTRSHLLQLRPGRAKEIIIFF